MAAYQVKRLLRNRAARRFPHLYASKIARSANALPLLDRSDSRSDPGLLELAEAVAAYYRDEYIDEIDSVAEGRFTFFGQSMDFGRPAAVDWHHEVPAESDFHLWRMKLGHMGFICPMLTSGDERHLAAVSELLDGYRTNSNFGVAGCFSSYWFPYSVSHRILAILSGYVVALERRSLPPKLCEEIEDFLRWNVAFLLSNVEHELRNNHVERNLAALAFYFSFLPKASRRRNRRLDREVRRVMRACILPDGLLSERSAMYQGLSVMALRVFAAAECLTPSTRAAASAGHERALRAWQVMTHPDGEIALFNDSWVGEVPPIASVGGTLASLGEVEMLPSAGYARLDVGDLFVIMDAGAIGPSWNPGHGQSDFLSLEIDVAARRFIVDPGTYQYSTGPRRAFERSASSHNGPSRRDVEPVEYQGCFRVGRMNAAHFVDTDAAAPGELRGRLDYSDSAAVERSVKISHGILAVTDRWIGNSIGAAVRLTVDSDWILTNREDAGLTFTSGPHAAYLNIVSGRMLGIEDGFWSRRYLENRQATVIVLGPTTSSEEGAAALRWEIRVDNNSALSGGASELRNGRI